MAAKATVNKQEEIRKILESKPDAAPKAVAASLAAVNIKVTPNYVSMVKSKMKSKAKPAANGHAGNGKLAYASTTAIDILLTTQDLAARVGGYSKLSRLVTALGKDAAPF